ncbi:MAG: hypothetical protein RQ801_01465 [Spirochaetaceae bacterium]|nr:hypothetical protein [Spirochaetaceae bacterium]MDT8296940.1 hypothetical protein [Spirochaetaceae bacterium]
MRCEEIMDFPYDPWIILGVAKDGDDEDVKAAWKRAGSPDSGIVYDAYVMLKDEVSRWRTGLLGPVGFTSASDALRTLKHHPTYVGSKAWYKAIARRKAE